MGKRKKDDRTDLEVVASAFEAAIEKISAALNEAAEKIAPLVVEDEPEEES
ncbi:MAG: hypothetical protein ACRDPE_23470 [Solirubrobacterales bacterium]